jgi:hypothetical protein
MGTARPRPRKSWCTASWYRNRHDRCRETPVPLSTPLAGCAFHTCARSLASSSPLTFGVNSLPSVPNPRLQWPARSTPCIGGQLRGAPHLSGERQAAKCPSDHVQLCNRRNACIIAVGSGRATAGALKCCGSTSTPLACLMWSKGRTGRCSPISMPCVIPT